MAKTDKYVVMTTQKYGAIHFRNDLFAPCSPFRYPCAETGWTKPSYPQDFSSKGCVSNRHTNFTN